MVDDTERYRFVTSQIQHHNDKIVQSFELFVKMIAAIFAGYIWLRVQPRLLVPGEMVVAIVGLVCLTTIMRIVFDLIAWWGYRKAERLLMAAAPAPAFFRSASQELLMILVVVVTWAISSFYILKD